jgi:hypothetical protein
MPILPKNTWLKYPSPPVDTAPSAGVIEDVTTFRNKEQVLRDLSKALHFSPESLEANRKGRLSAEQLKTHALQFIRPAILTVVFAAGPFVIWAWITGGRQQLSLGEAFPALFNELIHVNDLMEAHGTMGGVMMLGSILISLVIAALMASRVPMLLYFDLLAGKVEAREGRVVAREEQINRANGRDPIEKYFFSLRYLNMPVSLAAYRALEAGSVYTVYLLPRSEILASIEPKIETKNESEVESKEVESKKDDAAVAVTSPEEPSQE